MSKRILLYYPPSSRSIAIETICKTVADAGHYIIVLTHSEKGPLHTTLGQMGIVALSYPVERRPSLQFFYKHCRHLVNVCNAHHIDTVWSHLQEANFVAVFAQYFIKAKIVVFRHHDESAFYAEYGKQFGMIRNKKEVWVDRIINKLAKKIVVLSSHVLHTMIRYEKCEKDKIVVCPPMYEFDKYPLPDTGRVKEIKDELPCKLRLLMVSRMIESKQHLPVFETVKKMRDEGLTVKMIVLDDGPLRSVLEEYIRQNKLEQDIIMVGHTTDYINYMAASDMLIHPSLTEASNNVVKEMGWLRKTVAVCQGVGDFDDYVKDGENAYTMSRDNLKESIHTACRKAYNSTEDLPLLGSKLHKSVVRLFSNNEENRNRYLQLT